MKTILQHNERDCSAACLSMIAAHYGLHYPISKFRTLTKTDKVGTSLYGLLDGATQLGFHANALHGTPDELLDGIHSKAFLFPFIAHTVSENAMLHFVVVYGMKNGKFYIADPSKGKYVLSADAFYQRWTGYIAVFQKTDAFHPGKYTTGGFSKFFLLLKGQYARLVGVLLLSLIIAIFGILGSFVFQLIIDDFSVETGFYETESGSTHTHTDECSHGASTEEIQADASVIDCIIGTISKYASAISFHVIFIALIFLYILQAVIQYIRGYLIACVSKKIDIRLSLSYYNHIVDLPVSSLSALQTGEYLSRFSDTATIRQAISGATLTLLLDSIMVIGCGYILYTESKPLFFVSLIMVALYTLIVLLYRKPVQRSNRTVMESSAQLQSYFKESIDGMETIKASCAEEQAKATTTIKFNHFINAALKNNLISLSQNTLADTVELIGTVIILWIGFGLVLADQITVGSLITFYVLLSYFSLPIKNLIELQPMVQTAFVAADRLNDILDLEEETSQVGSSAPTMEHLEFHHINFRYGSQELALKDVNLRIQKGEKIAIVGESGSGKTTLAKLLLRFYIPESGSIFINGKDICNLELSSLRSSIAYVDQNTFLFSDTIRNNLKLGNNTISDEEMEAACRISKADEFINRLPLGYDTPLDENGANLSGGQRQRLAISRALLRKPQILILDEATSNLDTITESSIKRTVYNFGKELTCIIIAHRLTTIKNCDRIFVLDHGQIAECGTHEELLNANSKYKMLWNMQ